MIGTFSITAKNWYEISALNAVLYSDFYWMKKQCKYRILLSSVVANFQTIDNCLGVSSSQLFLVEFSICWICL